MNADTFPKNFWEILAKFPQIRNLNDLTKEIVALEENGLAKNYPAAYNILIDFEGSIRSQIYAEWHAPEFINEDRPDLDTLY